MLKFDVNFWIIMRGSVGRKLCTKSLRVYANVMLNNALKKSWEEKNDSNIYLKEQKQKCLYFEKYFSYR